MKNEYIVVVVVVLIVSGKVQLLYFIFVSFQMKMGFWGFGRSEERRVGKD